MKRREIGIYFGFLILAVVACDPKAAVLGLPDSYQTSNATLVTTYKYVLKDDLLQFRKSFLGNALQRFGNPEGIKQFQNRLATLDLQKGLTVHSTAPYPEVLKKSLTASLPEGSTVQYVTLSDPKGLEILIASVQCTPLNDSSNRCEIFDITWGEELPVKMPEFPSEISIVQTKKTIGTNTLTISVSEGEFGALVDIKRSPVTFKGIDGTVLLNATETSEKLVVTNIRGKVLGTVQKSNKNQDISFLTDEKGTLVGIAEKEKDVQGKIIGFDIRDPSSKEILFRIHKKPKNWIGEELSNAEGFISWTIEATAFQSSIHPSIPFMIAAFQAIVDYRTEESRQETYPYGGV